MPTIPNENAWSAWHPRELADRLHTITHPWCVVGGWALDLWHGEQTREHGDLEFTVLREHLPAFRTQLGTLDFFTVHSGTITPLGAEETPAPHIAQIWCFDRPAQSWRVDMMLEPGTPDTWVYKRAPDIRRPRAEMVLHTPDGTPYLHPAAILLFKAKYRRPKDEDDFFRALPRLEKADRAWLETCLLQRHPGHAWLAAL